LAGALIWLWIIRRKKLGIFHWWIGVVAIVLAITYHVATDPWLRQHDIDAHQEYVNLVIRNYRIPDVQEGWETFHPPFYYVLSAAWILLAKSFAIIDPWRWLQVLAAAAYLAGVCIASLAWESLGLNQKPDRFGLALFVFLPGHVFLSGRINNDVLLPLWGTLLTILIIRYLREAKRKPLLGISLCILGALMTKTSALPLLAGAALIIWWADRKTGEDHLSRMSRLSLMIFSGLLWLYLWGLRNLDQTNAFFYSQAGTMHSSLRIENTAFRYLYLDLRAILTEVYFSPWAGQIRESWPTTWLVSALFGEFDFAFLDFPLIIFLSAPFVLMTAFAAVGLFFQPSENADTLLSALALVGSHALFMLAFMWEYPFSNTQDFRLWAPVFFPLAILWSLGYRTFLSRISGPLLRAARAIPVMFFGLLGAFYLYLLVV
jgi:hypothetical protein